MSVSLPDCLDYLLDGAEPLASSYDEQADVLYLSRGEPREGVTLDSEEGHLVRLDPQSYEIVGFTIFGFSRRWQEDAPLTITVPSLGFQGGRTSKPEMHELVPA
jgi:uncharacterized protein YuzE